MDKRVIDLAKSITITNRRKKLGLAKTIKLTIDTGAIC